MKSVIKNLPIAIENPTDYEARSNLLWASTMGENRIIKLGKRCDFQVHQIEHQVGAYTDCNHGFGLAAIHPTYYRYIYKNGLSKFVGFAKNVWDIDVNGKTDEETALLGIDELEKFIKKSDFQRRFRNLEWRTKVFYPRLPIPAMYHSEVTAIWAKKKYLKY